MRNYIAGQFVADTSARTLEVFSPGSGSVISTVPLSGMDALNEAVEAAQTAFPAWSAMPAASVFTQSGGLARYVTKNASAGMIGVNIGVPVPRELFRSAAGTSRNSGPATSPAKAPSNSGPSSKR